MKSIAWTYNCGKCKCLVNISLWSSTLPPWRVPCVHKKLKFSAFTSFFRLQRSTKTNGDTKIIFHERHLYNHYGRYTQLTCLSEACQALRYDGSLLFISCKQLISTNFKNFCILAFKEEYFPWTFKHLRHTLPATGFSIVS